MVAARDVPLALAERQRSLAVGERVVLDVPTVPIGARCVVERAGFTVDAIDGREVRATRARALPDFTAGGLRLLLCGLNPSVHAADAGVGFVTGSNRFWPSALAAGIVTRDRDPFDAVRRHRVGFTDLVKRPTPRANEVSADEYRAGFAEVEQVVAWLEPEVVGFVGLSGWRVAVDRKAVAGWQERGVGGRPAYVMPNPSGINARATVAVIADHLRRAAAGPT